MKEDVEKTKQVGMNKHLNKPVEVEKLYATLLEFISKKIEDISNIDENSIQTNISSIEFKTLDTKYGLNLVMGMEKIYMKYLKGMLKYKDFEFENLSQEEFDREIHSIKGMSASAGALEVNSLAKQIEESKNKDLLPKFISKLNEVLNEIEEKLPSLLKKSEKKSIQEDEIDRLFEDLKEALVTKRAKNIRPLLEEIEKYKLNEFDYALFNKIRELSNKFKFKEALELLND